MGSLPVRIVVAVACLLPVLASGCSSTAVTPEALAAADCGAPPTTYEKVIPDYFATLLKDPYSAHYRYGTPYRAYLREAPVSGGKPTTYGYVVETWVNAKNGFGGYTGEKLYRVFLRDNVVQALLSKNPWFSEPWYQ